MTHVGTATYPLRFQKLRRAAIVFAIALLAVVWVGADAPPGPYFNGFETNTAGWFPLSGGTISRQPSGYMSGGYADGIPSATGSYHARLGLDPNPTPFCASGGGPQPVFTGPYTNWGGYSSIFPPGGYRTGVDVYLDVAWAQANFDKRFDWSSAVNNTTGMHRRDFVFNAATELTGFVISGSNNTTRCGANPATGLTPVHVLESGWYTFEHTFAGVAGLPLTVTMRLIHKMSGLIVGTWVLTTPTDIIGVTVGGNRYGWFAQNEIDDLAIDNSFRTGILSTPNCELKINDGGSIVALNGDVATFGGNAKVSSSGIASGHQEYQDHGPLQPITVNTIDVTAVTCSDDRTQASLFGRATVDGAGPFEYQIDLQDNGEPGIDDKYRIFIPGVAYESGLQTLRGGNVQIR